MPNVQNQLDSANKQSKQLIKERPYNFGRGYVNYSHFVNTSVLAINYDPGTWDGPVCHFVSQSAEWIYGNTPIYTLDAATLKLFENSAAPAKSDLFRDLGLSSEPIRYCILLPTKTFKTINGGFLDYLWIEAIFNDTSKTLNVNSTLGYKKYTRQIAPQSRKITSGGIDTNGTLWCSSTPYPTLPKSKSSDIGSSALDQFDSVICKTIRSITLQIVLAIECLPDAVEVIAPVSKTKGFAVGKSNSKETVWYPRRLKLDRQFYTYTKPTGISRSNRKPPRSHWRRFHWRRVATGVNRSERQWRLIQTTFVG